MKITERKDFDSEENDRFTGEWRFNYCSNPCELFNYSHGVSVGQYSKMMINQHYRTGKDFVMGPVMEIIYQSLINDEYCDKIGKCD